MWKEKEKWAEKFGIAWLCLFGMRWLQILLDILQYCEIFSDIANYCLILCNIVQYYKILPSITQYRSSGYFNALSSFDIVWIYIYCQILSSISRYCQALHNIVKHYAILSGIDQYCPVVLHVVKTYKTAQSSWNWKKVFNIVRNSWIFWKNI